MLTFFYRQYPEILKRELDGKTLHHLFIAQPPLFKVKKGKNERYLKNEQSLEDYLLEIATDDVKLEYKGGERSRATRCARWPRRRCATRRCCRQIEKKADARIVDALAKSSGLTKNDLKDQKATATALDAHPGLLEDQRAGAEDAEFALKEDAEHGGFKIVCPTRFGGARKNTVIDFAFLDSPEYEELGRLGADFQRFAAPYALEPKDPKDKDAPERVELDRASTSSARSSTRSGARGCRSQRYKGLGEMNAEQLWETTMDPATRTLLEVHADDLNAAEEIFSKLMGEEVEPRREFIEQNALNVRNLDV